ncbi:4Fe-4S binding protein [Paraburkholderia sacchari]
MRILRLLKRFYCGICPIGVYQHCNLGT